MGWPSTSGPTSGRSGASSTRCLPAARLLRARPSLTRSQRSSSAIPTGAPCRANDASRRRAPASALPREGSRQRLRDIGDADAEPAGARRLNDAACCRRWWRWPPLAATVIVASRRPLTLQPPPHPTGSISLALLPPDEQRFLTAPVPSPDATRSSSCAAPKRADGALDACGGDTAAKRVGGSGMPPVLLVGRRSIHRLRRGRKSKRIDVEADTIQTICVCAPELLGGTWGPNAVIVFAPADGAPLLRVAAAGGTPGTDHQARYGSQ